MKDQENELGVPGSKSDPVGLSAASPRRITGSGLSASIPHAVRLGELIATQDNQCTAHPIFIVYDKDRQYGFDPEYSDDTLVWVHCDGGEADEQEAKDLEAGYQDTFEVPENWYRTAYKDFDRFRTVCFTRAGCEEYLRVNGHNLTRPFIYVDSLHRNHEMIALREMLLGAFRDSDRSSTPQAGNPAEEYSGERGPHSDEASPKDTHQTDPR